MWRLVAGGSKLTWHVAIPVSVDRARSLSIVFGCVTSQLRNQIGLYTEIWKNELDSVHGME